MEESNPRPRGDFPGAWHHVTNRGLAHRAAFEGRSDVRAFLALLAWKVREGQLEVHAYAVLTTHFHLLLRSAKGELSNAMMWIENRYVKYFNRLRGRDGSLFRSRFRSRLIDTEDYWFNVIRYIDHNPVAAGLCARPSDYEFGSARAYCSAKRTPWLERSAIESTVTRLSRSASFEPARYERLFGSPFDTDLRWILERRLERGTPNRHGGERGNELLDAAPEHVLEWLRSRAELADGGPLGLTLAAPGQIEQHIRLLSAVEPDWRCRSGPKSIPAWRTLEGGLLRQLCGLSLQEISLRMQLSRTGVWGLCRRHAQWLQSEPRYVERTSQLVGLLREQNRPIELRDRPPSMSTALGAGGGTAKNAGGLKCSVSSPAAASRAG